MKKYKYKAIDLNGKNISGIAYGHNETQLVKNVKNKGLSLISFKEEKKFFKIGISNSELVQLTANLYYGIKSGLSITSVLDILSESFKNKHMRVTLKELREKILGGYSIYDSFKRTTVRFPEFYMTLIQVGENSGRLEETLLELQNYYKRVCEINKRTIQALMYPIFLSICIIICIIFLIKVPLPSIIQNLSLPMEELPKITRVLLKIGDIIDIGYMSIFLGALAILAILGKKVNIKRILSFLPIIRNLNCYKNKYLLFFSIKVMYSSGMDILTSIQLLGENKNFSLYNDELIKVQEDLNNGKTIAKAMGNLKMLNEYDLSMIEVSEAMGGLERIFYNLSQIYMDKTYKSINFFKSILSPVLLAICGVVIAVIMLGIYLPILTMMDYIV